MDIDQENQKYVVIIVGAGAAGIGAAVRLKKENVPAIVLEARNRLGGRLVCKKIDGVSIDLGGCWIHSYGKQNPLKVHVNNLKIQQTVLSKREVGRIFMDGEQCKQFDDDTQQVAHMNSTYFFKMAQKVAAKSQHDLSLYEAGKQFLQGTVSKFNPKERRFTNLLINMTQHYQASNIRQLSATNYQFRVDQGCDFLPEGGYGELLCQIAKKSDINIHYNKQVDKILYNKNEVKVICKDGSQYKAHKIISSLPLGVLKSGKIKFDPQLPIQYQKSIDKLGLGLMNKVIVAFEENFWGSVSWISIGCDQVGKFSQIYNLSQKGKHILCCFITDDFAKKCEQEQPEHVLHSFVQLLQKVFKKQDIKVKDWVLTRWGQEQFSLGSYSSFHTGSSPEDCYQLRKPIDNSLWMVGEHCYAEHIGTAHGAFKTGQWAADQVLQSIKWVNPILKESKKYVEQKKK